jgi:hypothetical protein
VERQEYEIRLLDFIENEFLFKDGSENEINTNETEVRISAFFFFSYCFETNFPMRTVLNNTVTVLKVNLLEINLHQV